MEGAKTVKCSSCQEMSLCRSKQSDAFLCPACEDSCRKRSHGQRKHGKNAARSEASEDSNGVADLVLSIPVSARAKEVLKKSLETNRAVPSSSKQNKGTDAQSLKTGAADDVKVGSTSLGSASSTTEAIEGELQCSICLELYAKPIILNECGLFNLFSLIPQVFLIGTVAGHTFCFLCLRADVAKRMKAEIVPSCPTCRHTITVAPSAPSVTVEKIIRIIIASKPKQERKEHQQRLKDVETQVEKILEKCGQTPWDWFKHQKPVFDPEDSVFRCPACVWELSTNGFCTNPNCGRIWKLEEEGEPGTEGVDGSALLSDDQAALSDDDGESDDALVNGENKYDSDDSFICDEPESVVDTDSSDCEDIDEGRRKHRKENEDESDKKGNEGESDEQDSEEELSMGQKMLKMRRRKMEAAKKAKSQTRTKQTRSRVANDHDERDTSPSDGDDEESCSTKPETLGAEVGKRSKKRRDSRGHEDEEAERQPSKKAKKSKPTKASRESPPPKISRSAKLSRKSRLLLSDDEDEGCSAMPDGGDEEPTEEQTEPSVVESSAQDDEDDQPCLVCGSIGNDAETLLCDQCNGAYHLSCVRLSEVPEGDWFCKPCRRARRAL